APIGPSTSIGYEDRSFAERIGWREIVVVGDGVRVVQAPGVSSAVVDPSGVSARLTSYPKDLLTQPLDERAAAVTVTPGGAALAAWSAPDATPVAAAPVTPSTATAGSAEQPVITGAVPGGVAENLAGLIDVQDLTPLAILASLLVAFGLGVVHAVS